MSATSIAGQVSMAAAPAAVSSPACSSMPRQQLSSSSQRWESSSTSAYCRRLPCHFAAKAGSERAGAGTSLCCPPPSSGRELKVAVMAAGGLLDVRRSRAGKGSCASRICHVAVSLNSLSKKSAIFRDWRRDQRRNAQRTFRVGSSVVSEQTAQESNEAAAAVEGELVTDEEVLSEQREPQEQRQQQQEDEEEVGDDRPRVYSTASLLDAYGESLAAGDLVSLDQIKGQLAAMEEEREQLHAQVTSLSEELQNGKERFLRLNADFDNFRKRSEREKASLGDSVKGDLIESLLPVLDNFERAKGQIKAETEKEKSIDTSYQGIYRQFVETLKSVGLRPVETVGVEFNPMFHEAIMREASPEHEEGIVMREFRKGFVLGERLIRPAMVMVSSGPPAAEEAAPAQEAPAAGEEVGQEQAQVE
ncbi:hypothetical protein CBR_g37635 [Chara braunii]|uniref:GrpE protein homolog n=1 Tax=Chara braunii TaxID=69332 RepID=A0A388LNA7_CHABU|nr:hypothetical protein CBR_g37635 [Chara braunii]|eukprot:GBG83836.1 hypothetical protein CBR_g37635 [Chara braunii]